jgi:acyl transferase domain-containing protein
MKANFDPIAIIGYGCVYPPDSYNIETFWENIVAGKPGISEIPVEWWDKNLYWDKDHAAEDKTYCKQGGVVLDYSFANEHVEGMGEGIKIEGFNRSQLMLVDTILQSLKMAKLGRGAIANANTGLVIGNMLGDSCLPNLFFKNNSKVFLEQLRTMDSYQAVDESVRRVIESGIEADIEKMFQDVSAVSANNILTSAICKMVGRAFGIDGPSKLVDGACSGSILAINEAIAMLQGGRITNCICSGVLGNMVVTGNVAFAKIGGLSATQSRPLDASADGLIPGEGVGTLLLKPLRLAEADGNPIWGVISGCGVSSDGKGTSIYAPVSKGQVQAMRKSLVRAGIQATDINYIETHATGTLVGDKVELNTLNMLFGDSNARPESVGIGSIKSLIGHSFSAAGMANIIKVLEGYRRSCIAPTHYFTKESEDVNLQDSPFYVNTKLKEIQLLENGQPFRASINAFGFGGINANVVLEQYRSEYHKVFLKQWLPSTRSAAGIDVAIVGIGVLDALGANAKDWWDSINSPDSNIHATSIDNFKFPSLRFKIPPNTLKDIDRSQQIALVVADAAIKEYGPERFQGERSAVFVGCSIGLSSAFSADYRVRHREYCRLLEQKLAGEGVGQATQEEICAAITAKVRAAIPPVVEDTLPGYMDNIIAGRIANFFNVTGVNVVCDADSASFSSALEQAVLALQSGEYDNVLVGGVNANVMAEYFDLFKGEQVTDGAVPAEGAVFFMLKPTSLVSTTDKVYARITQVVHQSAKAHQAEGLSACLHERFYFGAQGGFALLHNVLALHDRDIEKLFHAQNTEQRSCGATVKDTSVYGDGYLVKLCPAETMECQQSMDLLNDHTGGTVVLSRETATELQELLGTIIETGKLPPQENTDTSSWCLSFAAKDQGEVERKLKLVKSTIGNI